MARKGTRSVILLDTQLGEGSFDRSMLQLFDHDVTVCNGPEAATICPLLGGQGCEKFEGAHGIVFELDLDRPQHRAILRRYREAGRDDLPIRAVVTPEQARQYAAELSDVEVWDHSPTVADLDGFAAEVDAADRFA
jgi:hypothetical protein